MERKPGKSNRKSKSPPLRLVPAKGGGGRRPGAGRPRDPRGRGPGGLPWSTVRRLARLGADRELVIRAVGITPEQLLDSEVSARLAAELDRGDALHQVELLSNMARLRRGKDARVSAVVHSLRHYSGWGKKDAGGKKDRPDAEAACTELERLLARLGGR